MAKSTTAKDSEEAMRSNRARRRSVGKTVPEFARAYDLPESQVRRGVELGDVQTVNFAGLKRITPAEETRLCELFGLTPVGENEAAA
jgi:hypothetical protein